MKQSLFTKYSTADWSSIEDEQKTLPNFDTLGVELRRSWLRQAAARYQQRQSSPHGYVSLAERKRRWEKVLRSVAALEAAAIEAVAGHFGAEEVDGDLADDIEQVYSTLGDWRTMASDLVSSLRDDYLMQPHIPACSVRTAFFRDVLGTWCWLGGELKFSRHPLSGEVRGPLMRYFFAAVNPVMGDNSPSISSFPGIVYAYKKRIAAMAATVPASLRSPAGVRRHLMELRSLN